MPPEETIADQGTDAQAPTVAAPARAVRLIPKPAAVPVARRPPPPAASSYSAQVALPARGPRSALECKLAGLYDATDMLRVLDTEVALQRAKRLHGGGSRQTLRVAAIALFFTLLVAALGAMSYLQGKLAERGFSRHRADTNATANPVPGPSAPAAAREARPAGSAY